MAGVGFVYTLQNKVAAGSNSGVAAFISRSNVICLGVTHGSGPGSAYIRFTGCSIVLIFSHRLFSGPQKRSTAHSDAYTYSHTKSDADSHANAHTDSHTVTDSGSNTNSITYSRSRSSGD